jgi:hypothetical protein
MNVKTLAVAALGLIPVGAIFGLLYVLTQMTAGTLAGLP